MRSQDSEENRQSLWGPIDERARRTLNGGTLPSLLQPYSFDRNTVKLQGSRSEQILMAFTLANEKPRTGPRAAWGVNPRYLYGALPVSDDPILSSPVIQYIGLGVASPNGAGLHSRPS